MVWSQITREEHASEQELSAHALNITHKAATPALAAHNGKSQIQTEEPADHSSAQETTSTHQHSNVTDVNHA